MKSLPYKFVFVGLKATFAGKTATKAVVKHQFLIDEGLVSLSSEAASVHLNFYIWCIYNCILQMAKLLAAV